MCHQEIRLYHESDPHIIEELCLEDVSEFFAKFDFDCQTFQQEVEQKKKHEYCQDNPKNTQGHPNVIYHDPIFLCILLFILFFRLKFAREVFDK